MHRLVNTLALAASVITLGVGLWQDWGLLATMKRMTLSYLGFFFIGALLTLVMLSVPLFDAPSVELPVNNKKKKKDNSTGLPHR
jgi:hypothetical protein